MTATPPTQGLSCLAINLFSLAVITPGGGSAKELQLKYIVCVGCSNWSGDDKNAGVDCVKIKSKCK